MDYMEKLKAWDKIKIALNKIYDPKAKKLYHDAFLLKAIEEWGFNPEKPTKIEKPTTIKLQTWEQDMLKRIQTAQEYGIDIQSAEEKKKLDIDFRLEMLDFVRTGGKLDDLPDNLRNERVIIDAYFDAAKKLYES